MDNNQDVSGLPFEKLFELGEQKYNQMDYEQAQYYYKLAYDKKQHDEMILLCYANILKHNNKPQLAKNILNSSLKSNPNGTYKRYFQLAQIQNGQKSIQIFEKGIAVATKCLQNPFLNTAPESEIKRDIANAYASIAQVCMTDLVNVPFEQVQAKCSEVLQKGKAIDPTCMDIYLQIANCCIEKDQNEAAKNALMVIKQVIMQQKQELEDELVSQTAKYFMQIGQHKQSIQILQKLNESQNNNPQTAYLLAFCAFNMGDYDLCSDYISQYPEGQMIDEEADQAMKQLKIQLSKKTKKKAEETGQDNQGEEDEEWMDVEDDDDEENMQ